MRPRTLALLVAALALAAFPCPAHAGLLGLLSKAGKLGKVAKVGKVAKAGKALKVGAAAGKAAKVGAAAAGMTSALAAERAGVAFASLGDDAARGATFLARSSEGELLKVTRAAGTEKLGAVAAGEAVDLGVAAERPVLLVDLSAADTAPALAREHPSATLALVDGEKQLPLRQKPGSETGELVVDVAGDMVDLGDYLGSAADGGDGDDEEGGALPIVLGVGAVAAYALWQIRKWRASRAAA